MAEASMCNMLACARGLPYSQPSCLCVFWGASLGCHCARMAISQAYGSAKHLELSQLSSKHLTHIALYQR